MEKKKIKIIEVKQSVFANNNKEADLLRKDLKNNKTFLLNLMSSPGSGKTSTLGRVIDELKDKLKIGIMEADIDSDVDAYTIQKHGVEAIQVHTGGMCHLDAGMTREGLKALDYGKFDLAILENIGNLVCPAEFDIGADFPMMILSVPEGEDKAIKYPLMFTVTDALVVTKIDAISFFDFSFEKLYINCKKINSKLKIFPVSAKTGENMNEFVSYIKEKINFKIRK